MSGGLSSSCLQQRDPSGYPYMFHDPLHSLSSSYNSRAAAAACNPVVAHAQQSSHPAYASSGTPTSVPSTGTGKYTKESSSSFFVFFLSLGENMKRKNDGEKDGECCGGESKTDGTHTQKEVSSYLCAVPPPPRRGERSNFSSFSFGRKFHCP